MHVLFVTQSLPYPANSGGALRSLGLIRGLHEAEHKITLLSFDDGEDAAKTSPLRAYCDEIYRVPQPTRTTGQRILHLLTTKQPDLVQRTASEAMRERLGTLCTEQQFDARLEMATYLPYARAMKPRAKLIYDAFNAEYALQAVIAKIDQAQLKRLPAALYSRIQVKRIYTYEQMICQQADAVLAVSNEDAAMLAPLAPTTPMRVITSGIFCAEYTGEKAERGAPHIVFTGKMDYRPNVDAMTWFAREVMPTITAHVPQAKLIIVGQKPNAAIQMLGTRANMEVTGTVEAVQPYLNAAAVYIAPLRMGSGTRLKLLEAMASGCAIVATRLAAAGLEAQALAAMHLADDAPTFARAVLALLEDANERQRLGEAAQHAVRAGYDWSVIIPRLLSAYEDFGIG
jgi:polysaccharide biosynthesis protein PslH